MPTYEYQCSKCGHTFEKFQSIKDSALETCPKELCPQKKWGKGKVKRLLGAGAGLIFKGSGFYITDYRSENYKAAAKKDSGATSGSSSSGSSGSNSGGSGATGGSSGGSSGTSGSSKPSGSGGGTGGNSSGSSSSSKS